MNLRKQEREMQKKLKDHRERRVKGRKEVKVGYRKITTEGNEKRVTLEMFQ
jgi:hypothetical protein